MYKILIENAFNPQTRRADEIETYLQTLLTAYNNELEGIRKRTQVHVFLTRKFNEEVIRLFVLECSTEIDSSSIAMVLEDIIVTHLYDIYLEHARVFLSFQ